MDAGVLEGICSIPDRFYGWTQPASGKSILTLVQESDYAQQREALEDEELAVYLASHPEAIDQWLLYSLNKRTSEGWYVEQGTRLTEVGYLGDGRETEKYESRAKAVAVFIIRELDSVLDL